MSEELHVKLAPRLSELRHLATMVEEFGDANQLPLPKVFVVNLTLDELITNIVTHGSFRSASDPEIEIHLKVDRGVLILTMEDNGEMFDPTVDTKPDTTSSLEEREVGGLGLHLVKSFADRVSYEFVGSKNHVARTLDATLDGPMMAQARIAAHLVEAAEAAGYDPPRINGILEDITRETVLDEFWITDEQGFSYLTNVRDAAGVPVPFRFDPDPAVQPQASKFHVLLDAPLDGGDFITQPAQVREIDQQVYKYVAVGGVDKPRIVQVGFSEQEILTNVYASQRADVSAVIEGILGQHMTTQAMMLDHFVAAAEAAEWTPDDIDLRLRRIAASSAMGEIRVADASGGVIYSNLPRGGEDAAKLDMPHVEDIGVLLDASEQVVEHSTEPHATDGVSYKYVTVAGKDSRLVQVGVPIESSSGNLLYSVYQREADVLVRSRNRLTLEHDLKPEK